ncbi:MAG: hypothetical protein P4L69_08485 [Desulfosporosinus sp.]|nr:hypothetical protein [Desulfosporosinus sp.]
MAVTQPVFVFANNTEPFDVIKSKIKSLDTLLFSGSGVVPNTIIAVESHEDSTKAQFSHAGMAIRGVDLLPCVRECEQAWLKADGLYIFESIMSGKLNDGVTDVDGHSHLAVQLRDLEAVVKCCKDNTVAWCPLKESVRPTPTDLPSNVRAIYDRYLGLTYDASVVDLGGAAFLSIRWIRDCCFVKWFRDTVWTSLFGSNRTIDGGELPKDNKPTHWQFCSEMCTNVYKDLHIVPATCNPENVMPQDMVPRPDGKTTYDADCQFPVIFDRVVMLSTKA